MRVIAHNVEYFDLMRDRLPVAGSHSKSLPESPSAESALDLPSSDSGLRNSLWLFDGSQMLCWTDVEDLVQAASSENDRELPLTIVIPTDFYPTSIVLNKGILLGIEAELLQRRDAHFACFRLSIRSQLFLPEVLRRHLADYDPVGASSLALRYRQLPYFSHALEVLLHTVLDDEVDTPPHADDALLPNVVSFLSSFPDYLDIIVQCTRKTEVRSWSTLYSCLPPAQELFESSLDKGMLKTAGGYLLVLQTVEENGRSYEQCVRLLRQARQAGDWELCKELARFLIALDDSGDALREAMTSMQNGMTQEHERIEHSGTPVPSQSQASTAHINGKRNPTAPA